MPLPPPPEPRLEDMEPVQDLFEDEDYLEQELEAMSMGLPPPDSLTNPSSLPIIQSPPLSPTHADQIYLVGGSPMGQPYEYLPTSSSMSSPTRGTYQPTSPSLSPTHQNSHYRHSPPHTSPVHQPSYRFSPPPMGTGGQGMDHQSPPPSPLRRAAQYRASPPIEGVCLYRSQSGSPVRYQTEQLPGRPKSPLSKMSSQRSFQLSSQPSLSSHHHQAQGLRLQPSIAQIVRTNQPGNVMGNSSFVGQMGHSMGGRYQGGSVDVESRLVYQPSLDGRSMPQVQASLSSGALCQHGGRGGVMESNLLKDELPQRPSSAYRASSGGPGGVRYSQTPQISRSQSAAYYPVSEHVLERANAMPPCQLGSPEIPHMVRRPVSANTTEMKQHVPTPRPLIHSQSVGLRFSPSSNNISTGSTSNLGPGFRPSSSIQQMEIPLQPAYERSCDDISPISPSQGGGGLYQGETTRSRNTPFMGIIDKTARTQQYLHQPSRSRAMTSMDSAISPTSPGQLVQQGSTYSPPASLGNIAYYNKTNNAQNGHLLEEDYYSQTPPPSLGKLTNGSRGSGDILERVSQVPTYTDVKVARTLPVAQAYQDNMYRQLSRDSRTQGPTSPIKPKRPFVESNVWWPVCDWMVGLGLLVEESVAKNIYQNSKCDMWSVYVSWTNPSSRTHERQTRSEREKTNKQLDLTFRIRDMILYEKYKLPFKVILHYHILHTGWITEGFWVLISFAIKDQCTSKMSHGTKFSHVTATDGTARVTALLIRLHLWTPSVSILCSFKVCS